MQLQYHNYENCNADCTFADVVVEGKPVAEFQYTQTHAAFSGCRFTGNVKPRGVNSSLIKASSGSKVILENCEFDKSNNADWVFWTTEPSTTDNFFSDISRTVGSSDGAWRTTRTLQEASQNNFLTLDDANIKRLMKVSTICRTCLSPMLFRDGHVALCEGIC
jgi:hypothetical protein